METWFSSQHFHRLEIKAKRMNAPIVEVHFHFKWDVTTGYKEKHLVMVIHLCKIAVFHPVNSDVRLSQSFNYKIFLEGRRGQETDCPAGRPCPCEVQLRAASASTAKLYMAKASHKPFVQAYVWQWFVLSQGATAVCEAEHVFEFLAEWGPSWWIQPKSVACPSRSRTPAGVTAASLLPVVLHLQHTHKTDLFCVPRVPLQPVADATQTMWSCSSKPHGYNLVQILYNGIISCGPACHSVFLMSWAQVTMPCEGHTSPRSTHSMNSKVALLQPRSDWVCNS